MPVSKNECTVITPVSEIIRCTELESPMAILRQLKLELQELKSKLSKRETSKLYFRYQAAINDIINEQKLEEEIPELFRQPLTELRNYYNCHYLFPDDDNCVRENKIFFIHDKLVNIPVGVKELFEEDYPGLIEQLLPKIKYSPEPPLIAKSTLRSLNMWWDL